MTKTRMLFTLPFAALGLMLSTSPGQAQSRLAGLRGIHHAPAPASRLTTPSPGTPAPNLTSPKFTILNFPGTLTTVGFGINSGAASSKIEIVGAIGNNTAAPIGYFGGFLMHYTKATGTATESFHGVNIPGATQQAASGVNDSGQIVGYYSDGSGVVHGYLESGGKFTIIDVPFSGATSTAAFGINNAGEIAGEWSDATTYHGFLLSGGIYTSLDYPGAVYTVVENINNNGDMVGQYNDTSGIQHGFSLSGGTYNSIGPPGSTSTVAFGINDAGDIVGTYCPTSECAANYDTFQGFLLSGGTYTTIAIPGATASGALEINNKGVIVGTYFDSVGNSGFLAIP